METVKRGSRGLAARMAQMLLNDRINELPDGGGNNWVPLSTDGIFGPKSEKALMLFLSQAYQMSRMPLIDGEVWRKLGLKTEIDHRVTLVGQPAGGLCWSSAAAMVLGGPMSVSPGAANLTQRNSLEPSLANLQVFAQSLDWRMVPPTQNVAAFATLIRRSPVWVAGQGTSANGRRYGHAVVVSGMWSDGDPAGSSTLLRIHDPWPTPRGRIFDTLFFGPVGICLPGGVWLRPDAMLVPR